MRAIRKLILYFLVLIRFERNSHRIPIAMRTKKQFRLLHRVVVNKRDWVLKVKTSEMYIPCVCMFGGLFNKSPLTRAKIGNISTAFLYLGRVGKRTHCGNQSAKKCYPCLQHCKEVLGSRKQK